MALTVEIFGTDWTPYLQNRTLVVTSTDGNRAHRCDFTLIGAAPSDFTASMPVIVTDGATTYFDGTLVSVGITEHKRGIAFTRVTATAPASVPSLSEAPFSLSDTTPELTYQRWVDAWGPSCWWRLGETSGTNANDDQGTQDATYVGSPTLGVTGAMTGITDKAVTLNGTSQYLTAGAANLRGRTWAGIMAWAKTSATPAVQVIYAERSTLNDALIRFYIDTNGRPVFQWRDDAGTLDTITPASGDWSDGQWHQFAVTKDDADVIIYVDGIGVAIDTLTATNTQTSTMTANIGRDPHLGTGFFSGSLDEVMLQFGALDREAIKNLYAMRDVRPYLSFTSELNISADGLTLERSGTAVTLQAGLEAGQEFSISSAVIDPSIASFFGQTTLSGYYGTVPTINEVRTEWVDETPRFTVTFGDPKPRLAAAFP